MTRIAPHQSPRWVVAQLHIALALVVFGAAGCDVHGVSAPGTLTSITLVPSTTLLARSTSQMLAVGRDAEGRVVEISPEWSIVAGGGTIDPEGLFSAGSVVGTYANTIEASVGDISAHSTVTVTAGPLAVITVTPGAVSLPVSATHRFVAIASDAAGNILSFTPTWSVVAGGGTIDADGKFTAGSDAGTFAGTVQASSGGIKGLATVVVLAGPLASIRVTPSPDTLAVGTVRQFVAVGTDVSGNAVSVAVSWAAVNGGGTIDGGGLFTAGPVPGTFEATVEASSGTVTGNATVVVVTGPLFTLTVTPNPATMVINGAQQFVAVGRDRGGNPVQVVPTWTVASGGGTITAGGRFTAGTVPGTYAGIVRATVGALSGAATVVVTAGALSSIIITPNPANVEAGNDVQFSAVGADSRGNVFPIAPVWSVASGGGAIDRNSGLFTAGATAGTFAHSVRATSGGFFGTATVVVMAAPVVGFTSTFENFSVGAIDQQFDWRSIGGLNAPPPTNPLDTHCRVYDHEITDNTAAAGQYQHAAFQRNSLRMSNAVTFGCYTDQVFSNRTPNYAGAPGAARLSKNGLTDYALAGGVPQNHFEAEWSVASTVPNAEQPGLEVVVSPGRGDDSRMSWVQMADRPDGLAVVFAERSNPASPGAFQLSTVATGLDRRVPHTIKLTMDFHPGPSNDVVRVFVDGTLRHTGTSWENYYFYDVGGRAAFGGNSPIVNRLMFRTGSDALRGIPGDAAPDTRGFGFVFDNVRQATFMVSLAAKAR